MILFCCSIIHLKNIYNFKIHKILGFLNAIFLKTLIQNYATIQLPKCI